jgi:AcrR family transcriptional regulator
LQDALLSLLKTRSFDSITPRDITAEAGLAYGTFYRHHPSKEAMLEELARREIADLYDKAMSQMEEGGSFRGTLALCKCFEENRELWSALLNGGANTIIRDELARMSHRVAEIRGYPGDRLPPDLSNAVANAAVAEIIAWWLRQDGRYSAEYAAELMVELVHEPIRRLSTSPNLKLTGTSKLSGSGS